MRHNQHIPRSLLLAAPKLVFMKLLPQLPDQRIHSFRNVRRTLATLAAVAPNVPVLPEPTLRAVSADLGRGETLVVAVVPFADLGRDLDFCGGVVVG